MVWAKRNGLWQLYRDPTCLLYADAEIGNVDQASGTVSKLYNRAISYQESARNPVQATQAAQPSYVASDSYFNKRPSMQFATSKYLRTGSFSAAIAQPNTTYTVFRIDTGVAATSVLVDGLTTYSNQLYYFVGPGVSISSGSPVYISTDFRGVTCVARCVYNGASSALYINSKTALATGSVGANTATGLTIGCRYDLAAFFSGRIAALIVYSGVHSDAYGQRISSWLGQKYGAVIA